jgi:hypothetical protein
MLNAICEEDLVATSESGEDAQRPPDYESILGCEDITAKGLELLTTPNGALVFFIGLSKGRSFSDPITLTLAFYLLPRLKLGMPMNSKYSDRTCADVMANSCVVNQTYELLPDTYKKQFVNRNPFWGFTPYIAARDISLAENERLLSILGSTGSRKDSDYQEKVTTLQVALKLLLEDDRSISNDPGTRTLPLNQQLPSDQRTADLISGLGDYFAKHRYGGLDYHRLVVLAECIAYVKHFYRQNWRVESEDVLEAWYFVNYCKTPRPTLSLSSKKILRVVEVQNRAGNLPTQRQIIAKTGLANNIVSRAVGLKIKSAEGSGKLIVDGYVEFDEAKQGYQLTELGKFALTNDFHIVIDGIVHRPKNPLES